MGWTVLGASRPADLREENLAVSYSEHVPALCAYVNRLVLGDQHKAEDIVQETLLRCWRKFGTTDAGLLRPWLFKTARNLVIDGYRRSQSRPQEVQGLHRVTPQAAEIDEIERTLTSVVLSDALQALSPTHQEVLGSIYFQGKTIEGTAQSLGIPTGTVKSRVFYALRSLKLALQERGYPAPSVPGVTHQR
ncbi:sigma-70 family RNA polymerase sigma factor [Streptomyces massasporeus]|uniref:sigma-70 family RNA polymerase sigma factor n=1 Tax=Streptomyces massasporeus TaxID=67324 RepID=UPI00378AE183